MKIDIQKLLEDFGVSHTTSGKHSRPGWVQIECPLCTGNPGWHGGFNVERNYYNCWRCGWHRTEKVLSSILGEEIQQIRRILKSYELDIDIEEREEFHPKVEEVEFPMGTGPLQERHKQYLENRYLDPEYIEKEWGILGTGPLGDYNFRIIAPIHYQEKMVSYQGRDITGKSNLPYKACPKHQEVIHHKQLIYGIDKVKNNHLLVEGIFDVWNVGPGTGGTFGIDYTEEQVAKLVRFQKTIFIMFDAEEEKAQEKAIELKQQLYYSVDVILLDYGDPGELPEDDIITLRKELKI